jgi:hypothetical protein
MNDQDNDNRDNAIATHLLCVGKCHPVASLHVCRRPSPAVPGTEHGPDLLRIRSRTTEPSRQPNSKRKGPGTVHAMMLSFYSSFLAPLPLPVKPRKRFIGIERQGRLVERRG